LDPKNLPNTFFPKHLDHSMNNAMYTLSSAPIISGTSVFGKIASVFLTILIIEKSPMIPTKILFNLNRYSRYYQRNLRQRLEICFDDRSTSFVWRNCDNPPRVRYSNISLTPRESHLCHNLPVTSSQTVQMWILEH
jgi:hypothetical protein